MKQVKRKKIIKLIIKIVSVLALIGIIFIAVLFVVDKIDKMVGKKEFAKIVNNTVDSLKENCIKQKQNNEDIIKLYNFKDGEIIPNIDDIKELPRNGIIELNDSCDISVNVSNEYFLATKTIDEDEITVLYGKKSNYKAYKIGDKIKFDPGDGITRNWYVIKNSPYSDKSVEVILEKNIRDNIEYYPSQDNKYGPIYILSELNSLTSNWTNTILIDDIIDNVSYNNWARLISANEVAYLTNNTTWDSNNKESLWFYFDSNNQNKKLLSKGRSKYTWLFSYTKDCTESGCAKNDDGSYGYWTSSKDIKSSKHAWGVGRDGSLDVDDVTSTSKGIRPVIVIDKEKI